MKNIFLLLLILISFSANAQNKNIHLDKTLLIDTINLCKERGHIVPEICMSTAMYCPPYYIETDSSTIKVYPSCNYITYTCERCSLEITEREREKREVIWRKGDKTYE